jgi:hypothetical protein
MIALMGRTPLVLVGVVVMLASAGCDEASPPWCTATAPLSVSCPGPHCVAAVVIDYKRLEPRGYRVFALDGAPIDAKEAEARAINYVQTVLGAPAPDAAEARRDLDFFDVYLHYTESGDSYLVILHAPTGQLLFAGLEQWADVTRRGYDFPLPEGFKGPEALGCAPTFREPEEKQLITTGAPMGTAPASTSTDALRVARQLNLMPRFIGDRPYQALVISHAPAVGEFDEESADWYVWLYRL